MFALSLAVAAALLSPARDPEHFYTCEMQRGNVFAYARLSEAGALSWGWFVWSPPGFTQLSLSRHWDLARRDVRALLSYRYGRGRRIRFAIDDVAGTRLLLTEPVRARDRVFSHSLPWDQLRAMASHSGSLQIRVIAGDGVVVDTYAISLAQLDGADQEAAQITGDFAAMVADYRNRCDSSRDIIFLVG